MLAANRYRAYQIPERRLRPMPQQFALYGPNRSTQSNSDSAPVQPLPEEIQVRGGTFRCQHSTLTDGPSRGVDLLRITGNRASFILLPTRGMSLWQATLGDLRFGWDSPVRGPVHPSLVPVTEPSGLGWLSGFDELLVRCGLESNGAPEFDESGRLRYPLHGRIANLPAHALHIHVDEDKDLIEITGEVYESRLFFANWTLRSTIRFHLDGNTIEIEDTVINGSDQPAEHQLLYHINVGAPVLEEGAQLVAPIETMVPKTPRAVEGVETFATYEAPQPGFAEQVYLMQLQHDDEGQSRVMLRSQDASRGMGVEFDTHTLPYFIQWKNTGGLRDGYVTGLEPATNFPNTRSFEGEHGRVVQLPPGGEQTYRLRLHLMDQRDQVDTFEQQIEQLQSHNGNVSYTMRDDWCE